MEEVLKKYDKLLTHKKNLDGSVDILRQSPFNAQQRHKLFTISNQYVGTAKWVIKKLISMDTTRNDLVGKAMRHNWAIRNAKDSRNIHEDLADFIVGGGSTFVN
jgi:hypothetical protein